MNRIVTTKRRRVVERHFLNFDGTYDGRKRPKIEAYRYCTRPASLVTLVFITVLYNNNNAQYTFLCACLEYDNRLLYRKIV
jgi:hypothetical protein